MRKEFKSFHRLLPIMWGLLAFFVLSILAGITFMIAWMVRQLEFVYEVLF